MSPPDLIFRLGPQDAVSALLERVGAAFPGVRRTPEQETAVYLDTFDVRLHAAGGTLQIVEGEGPGRVSWSHAAGSRTVPLNGERRPAFSQELPAGEVRRLVAPLIESRRLFPIAEVRRRRHVVDILDDEEKTVCRVVLEERAARAERSRTWKDAPDALVVRGLRGYAKARAAVERFVRLELGLAEAGTTEIEDALAIVGAPAGAALRESTLQLDPAMPTRDAVRLALSGFLEAMTANREGTCRDLDIEFLHDFRVAVRRTRSLLGQVPHVFPETAVEHYEREFKWLGALTGPTRDLDVFRERLPHYEAALPEPDAAALGPFHRRLEELRGHARSTMVAGLQSERYQRLVDHWDALLRDESEPRTVLRNASRPVGRVASKRIRRRFERVLESGAQADFDQPDTLHALRIQCKKLRYLLEVFRSLYDRGPLRDAIRELKRLQHILGDINDFRVHATMIQQISNDPDASTELPSTTWLALGRLLSELDHSRLSAREPFERRFARFTSKRSRKRFRAVLKGGKRA